MGIKSKTIAAGGCLRAAKTICSVFLTVGAVLCGATTLVAQTKLQPIIVGNDRGGLLQQRLDEIQVLRASGQPVHITGSVCLSTCTMYLGLPQTCISPQTTFGFHGPSAFGLPLNDELFDWASAVIAGHYPQPLQDWYMTTGRYRLWSLYRISGDQIIQFGVRQCKS